jgi:8-oxo-dGTP pyrophosphatase MutT (NUDIX family)
VWDLVGGHLEDDETPEQALVRECREELGVEVHEVDPPRRIDLPDGVMWVFLVRSWSGEPRNAAPEEHDAIGWLDPAALPTTALADPRLTAAIQQAVSTEAHTGKG